MTPKKTRTQIPEIKIFLSSPGDVNEERVLAGRVLQRLTERYAPVAKLVPIIWEHEPLLASATFQDQIEKPSTTDIVVCILWSRLGTRLPPHIQRADGSRYDSGTEFEFEDAWDAIQRTGRPDLLVYRKMSEPFISLASNSDAEERLRQKRALDGFIQKWFHDEDGSLLAAFHGFGNSAEFEEAFETHLDKLVQRRIEELGVEPLSAQGTQAHAHPLWEGSPFRGLETFEFEHAPVFYGRTHAISGVLKTLRAQAAQGNAFVLVLGRSGGGKSSLVRAGVLPLLVEPGVVEGVGLWRRAVFRPSEASGSLNKAFAAALSAPLALPELLSDGTTVDELGTLLDSTPKGADLLLKGALSQAAQALATQAAEEYDAANTGIDPDLRAQNRRAILQTPPAAKLVLLVDQLEELFTDTSIPQSEREAFLDALSALAASGRVYVVATLRSDFYQHAIEQPMFAALKGSEGQYDLSAPTPAEIGQIIRQPALRAGLSFEEHPDTGARLDDDLRDAAVAEPDSLPLLEFTLEELYRARSPAGVLTWEAYEALGGLAGALGRRAEEAYQALPAAAQAALPRVMRRVVHVRLDRDQAATKRAASMDNFAPDSPGRALIDAFVAARLFVVGGDSAGNTVVTLTHEALLGSWPRLQDWLAADQEFLRIRTRVNFAADRWEESGREAQLLLPTGPALDEARQITQDTDADIPETLTRFIALSSRRARRARRLKQMAIAALAVLTFAASATAWFANSQRQEAAAARVVSETAQIAAENNAATAQSRLGELFFEQGRQALLDGQAEEATLLLGAAYGAAPKEQTGALFSSAHALASIKGPSIFESSGAITTLATGPDNLTAIAAAGGSITVRDMSNGAVLARLRGDGYAIKALAFSPDGQFVAAGSDSGTVLLWDLKTKSAQKLEAHFQAITRVYFSRDGTTLASLSHDRTTRLWRVQDAAPLATLAEQGGTPVAAAFDPENAQVITLTSEGQIARWDSTSGQEMLRCTTNAPLPVLDGTVLNGGHAVLALGSSGLIKVTLDADCQSVWENPTSALGVQADARAARVLVRNDTQALVLDADTGKTLTPSGGALSAGTQRQIIAADLTQDGGMISVIDTAGTMTLLDASAGGTVLARLDGHASSGSAIAFSRDGSTLVTAAVDGTLTPWTLAGLRPCVLPGAAGRSLRFSPDGTQIASGDSKGQVTLAKVADCTQAKVITSHPTQEWVRAILFSADGTHIASAAGGLVTVSDAQTGAQLWQHAVAEDTLVSALAWNHDQTRLLVGARARKLAGTTGGWLELERATGAKTNESKDRPRAVTHLDFWNDATYVITRSPDGLHLWWQDTGRERHRVANRNVRASVYWPDRTRIALGNADGELRIIRHTNSELFRFAAHNAPISALAIDATGQMLASGANDGDAALWDAQTGTLVARLIGHTSTVASMLFVPASSYVLSADTQGTVILWDLVSGAQVARYDGPAGPAPQLAVTPKGDWFSLATGRGNTRLWRLGTAAIPTAQIMSEVSAVTPWGLKLDDGLPQDRWQTLALQALADQVPEGEAPPPLETRQRLETGRIAAVRGDALAAARSWQQMGDTGGGDTLAALDLPAAFEHALAANAVALQGLTHVLEDHQERVENIVFSQDGSMLASVDWSSKLVIWNTADWSKRHSFEDGFDSGMSFSPEDTFLLTQGQHGGLVSIDLATGQETLRLPKGRRGVWSRDAKRIAAFPRVGAPTLYDATNAREIMRFDGYSAQTTGFAISRDFGMLGAPQGNGLDLLNTVSRSVQARVSPTNGDTKATVTHSAFSPDGTLIAVVWSDKTGGLYQVADGSLHADLPADIDTLEFSPDGTNMLVETNDDSVRVIDTKTGTQRLSVAGSLSYQRNYVQNGQQFVTVNGTRRTVTVHDLQSGAVTGEYGGHATAWLAMAAHPQGTARVTSSGDGQLRVWDAAVLAGARLSLDEPVPQLAENVLARFSDTDAVERRGDFVVLTHSATTGTLLNGHRGRLSAASFGTNATSLFTGGEDSRLLIWDIDRTTGIAALKRAVPDVCDTGVAAVLPTRDGSAVWVYCNDGSLRLFDTAKGRAMITQRAIAPERGRTLRMHWALDGKTLQITGAAQPMYWRVAP